MKRLLSVAALIVLLPLASITTAQAADSARARLDAFAQSLHSLTGTFTQTMTDVNGQTGKPSSGTLALEAPREFRWDTLAPYKQTIVADGSRVWMYDPELDQVTVRRQDSEEAHSPLTVLTDLKQMDRDFKVSEQGAHDGLVWLRLEPAGTDAPFDHADLGFDAGGLARMTFRDQLGATTDIRFSGWHRNAPIPADAFDFVPPKGADVIGDLPVLSTQPLKN